MKEYCLLAIAQASNQCVVATSRPAAKVLRANREQPAAGDALAIA